MPARLSAILALVMCLMAFPGCVDDASKTTSADQGTSASDGQASMSDGSAQGTQDGGVTAMDSSAPRMDGSAVDSAMTMADARLSPEPDQGVPCVVLDDRTLCDPNPPNNDPVGMVCSGDGTAEEAYCMYNEDEVMVCARSANGGPCTGSGNGPGPDPMPDPMPQPGDMRIQPLDQADPLSRFFTRQITVFGVRLVASAAVPDAKLSHAATIMAEYLDNNEDGVADDPAVVGSMVRNRALLIMFGSGNELENSAVFESGVLNGYWGQDLQADETNMPGRFDAALEEVLHLISTSGYGQAYPDAFGERPGTRLTDAMDLARGGRFERIPNPYPDGAWYHYDDATCDYRCMATEYFYWALTTLLGAQNGPGRCAEIRREWELCTSEALRMGDPTVHGLLTDPQYHLPEVLPDGQYGGRQN